MNRNFAKLESDSKIAYAPDGVIYDSRFHTRPTAEMYAANGWLPLVSEPPTEVGCTFTPTERGEERDGKIYRLYDRHPIPAAPVVYIVEEIIYQLIGVGKLQAVKAVVGDYWELLTMRERVDANNEIFKAAFPQFRAALVAQGVFASEDKVDALLAKCREGYEEVA